MSIPLRTLAGQRVSLSISESDDSDSRGFPDWQVNRVTLQIVSALFGQGVGLIFGHDWREDGVMEAVHAFAQQVQPPFPIVEQEQNGQPLLWNCLGWPDRPSLSRQDLERLSSTLRIEVAPLPQEITSAENEARAQGKDGRLYKYFRARGLTALRKHVTDVCTARICIGGRGSRFEGRYSGIVEEIALAMRARRPLYLSGLLGGATAEVFKVLAGARERPPFLINELYADPPFRERSESTTLDREASLQNILDTLRPGLAGVAKVNLLSIEENEELFHTRVIERVIQLVLTGLGRIQAREHEERQ